MIELRLQQLADSMTTARVSAWLKREGDRVRTGEVIVEVETDKATVEIEAPGSGVIEKVCVPAGSEGIGVGTLLALINDEKTLSLPAEPDGDRALVAAANAAQPDAPDPPVDSTDSSRGAYAHVASATGDGVLPGGGHAVSATPLASRMAELAGLDLATLSAARPDTRLTKRDVAQALAETLGVSSRSNVAESSARPAGIRDVPQSTFHDHPLSPMRRVTAARLQEAKQNVPHFYLQARCRVGNLIAVRHEVNARNSNGIRVTITDLLVFIAARALQAVPLANSAWFANALRVYDSVDIAVAVNTTRGLITPVVRASHAKSIRAISRELHDLTDRASKGALRPEEYSGGTFTISNLGMFGVSVITPIVNPPQACILGVGAIEAQPAIADNAIVIAHVMECTLAADHRAIDGATGAELLVEIRRLIEDPSRLAFEL